MPMKSLWIWVSLLGVACTHNAPSDELSGQTVPALWGQGSCTIPQESILDTALMERQVVGLGTPQSCTAEAFTEAVAQGGHIVFDCGTEPHTITLQQPALIFNDAAPEVIIDGGGLITLSGGQQTRILYMNTCDPELHWTTPHCQNQDHPRLMVRNLVFRDGNARTAEGERSGGAIFAQGGRLSIVNCSFYNNMADSLGPDVGGGAVRALMPYDNRPVYVIHSSFGGSSSLGNRASNGGALSSIGVSWYIVNSEFTYNQATGFGANPAQSGTPGGGSGGAIYNDGNRMELYLCGSSIQHNTVNAHGGAIFFVSNNHTGSIHLEYSILAHNPGGSWYPLYPGISMHADTPVRVVESRIEP